jgi:isocitrate dehydrogenase (NAD+)
MTTYPIVLLPGDGIGPEVAEATRRCLDATGVQFAWQHGMAGEEAIAKKGTPLPDATLDLIRKTKLALKAPITTPIGQGFRSVNVAIRKSLNLYACVRPCKTYAGVASRYQDIDITIVRENTEDLYAGIEYKSGEAETQALIKTFNEQRHAQLADNAAISIKPISPAATRRVVQYAFTYAAEHGKPLVTAVTKANIMKETDGLFYQVARQVAEEHRETVAYDERLIDAICMQLVLRPEQFHILVLPNLYGDIISDLCAGLVGGLGVAPGVNIGDDIAVFEAVHGSAPKYAGQNRVNPTALILSGVLLLRHIGEGAAADRLEGAVSTVLREGVSVTYDLKADRNDPTAVGTQEMADAIIQAMPSVESRA